MKPVAILLLGDSKATHQIVLLSDVCNITRTLGWEVKKKKKKKKKKIYIYIYSSAE